jgi:cytochrome P450
MLHDETIYPDPFEFNPDRFMKDGHCNDDVKDPAHATFGFGRRYGVL